MSAHIDLSEARANSCPSCAVDALCKELEEWRRLFTKLDEALDVYALCRTTDRMRSELRRMVPPEST